MSHYKKKIESEFDDAQLRRANQLLLIDDKNDKGLSTQRPLRAIKSNRPHSHNVQCNDDDLEDDVNADTNHAHNVADASELDVALDYFDTPTEESSETDVPPTLGHAMATIDSKNNQPKSIDNKILHSNYFLNLE